MPHAARWRRAIGVDRLGTGITRSATACRRGRARETTQPRHTAGAASFPGPDTRAGRPEAYLTGPVPSAGQGTRCGEGSPGTGVGVGSAGGAEETTGGLA